MYSSLMFQKKTLAHWYMAPNFHHLHLPTIIIFCAKTTKCCANRPWTESGRRMDRSYPLNLSMLGRKLQNEIFSQMVVLKLVIYHGNYSKVKKNILTISKLLGDTLETNFSLLNLLTKIWCTLTTSISKESKSLPQKDEHLQAFKPSISESFMIKKKRVTDSDSFFGWGFDGRVSEP